MIGEIIVRLVNTENQIYRHELAKGEKPWEILNLLMQMDFGYQPNEIEFVMDPQRAAREQEQAEKLALELAKVGQP